VTEYSPSLCQGWPSVLFCLPRYFPCATRGSDDADQVTQTQLGYSRVHEAQHIVRDTIAFEARFEVGFVLMRLCGCSASRSCTRFFTAALLRASLRSGAFIANNIGTSLKSLHGACLT
jgi:hypothetical protein